MRLIVSKYVLLVLSPLAACSCAQVPTDHVNSGISSAAMFTAISALTQQQRAPVLGLVRGASFSQLDHVLAQVASGDSLVIDGRAWPKTAPSAQVLNQLDARYATVGAYLDAVHTELNTLSAGQLQGSIDGLSGDLATRAAAGANLAVFAVAQIASQMTAEHTASEGLGLDGDNDEEYLNTLRNWFNGKDLCKEITGTKTSTTNSYLGANSTSELDVNSFTGKSRTLGTFQKIGDPNCPSLIIFTLKNHPSVPPFTTFVANAQEAVDLARSLILPPSS